jgi:hypothetical protein
LWLIYGFRGAHVESPISGSMILVDVYWTLGGYELLPVFPVLFRFGFSFGVIWVVLSLVGGNRGRPKLPDREKRKITRCHHSQHIPRELVLGSNRGPRGQRPATNRLSHSMGLW